MSIYPEGTDTNKLTRLYNLRSAVGDLPVPQSLKDWTEDDVAEQYEWINYVASLPVSLQLKKLGEGIDLLVETVEKTPNDFQKIDSIDRAASLVAVKMLERLRYPVPEAEGGYCGDLKDVSTYYEPALFFIIGMMKGVSSPDLPVWEKRLGSLKAINPTLQEADKVCGRPFGTAYLKSSPPETPTP